ncbi:MULTISPECIES: efflux RND transporter periplasmic adaptor subunit [Pseudomonas]|uniref:Efflux RND transporter periplasmic adaptor subunit n=1 Tax=Pseudomonas weihenstephanensis TaxID=1608994 RepID=A0ABS1ZM06_9PSED|nr:MULTISPECIES: efflux RND transporter periplasmic adaptor subunit [unclassified Pseudomonas]KVV08128.1 Efflux pump periplasmic linker BepF [Pseudomonas sp. TAD18]KVV09379.1 Efflux pump periplasmic linker BepF [Pseudomonas sp. TAA207]MBM1197016.1 efflux RND transporter periplasmic adaptor subunit [Pseudomonas weihenstephanensis]
MRVRLVAVTGMITTALLISGCNKKPDPASTSPAPSVEVARVTQQAVKTWDSFNGRVSATDTVSILPRVGGYITRVAYREGSEVKKGDLLFVIDQRPYRTALDSARAQLERARASLALASQQDLRAQQLLKSSAVSKEEAEQKRAARDQSLADVHTAESAVAAATLNLEFTEVRSPINGRTGRAQLTLGNLAVADQSELTSVVSQNPVYVYFDPDEHSYLNYLKTLKTVSGTSVRIGLANDETLPYVGELNFLDNQVNATTGTVRARATVDNSERLLTPGLYAKVQLSVGDPAPAILVPDRAILTDQDKHYVYVLSADNTAQKRYIETGQLIDKQRVITSGLERNNTIIVSGLHALHADGTAVTPQVAAPGNTDVQVPRLVQNEH